MSRIEYNEDGPHIFWGGWAKRALGGKRGQAALAEIEQALLALPHHRLIANHWAANGEVCLLGALHAYRTHGETGESLQSIIDRFQPEPLTFTRDASGEYPLIALLNYDPSVTIKMHYSPMNIYRGGRGITLSGAYYSFPLLDPSSRRIALDEDRMALYADDDSDEIDAHDAARMLDLSWVFAWNAIEHNDEQWYGTPEQRWEKALAWVRRCQADPQKAYQL